MSRRTHNPNLALRSGLRASVTVALCLLLPGQMLLAQTGVNLPATPKPSADKSASDPRILHLLNRFTFGPAPEEIAAVQALGRHAVDKWFDQQLDPDSLPQTLNDKILSTRLAALPAMRLPVDQLLGKFPSGAIIRQTANGKLVMPDDPYLYAIYRRHIDLYEDKQAKKAEAKHEPAQPAQPAKPDASMQAASSAQPAEPVKPAKADVAISEAIENATTAATMTPAPAKNPAPATADTARPTYADLLVKSVLALPPAQRVSRVLKMQPAEYEQFRSGLKGPLRAQLAEGLTPEERELLTDFENPTRAVIEELQSQRLLRDIYSSHQLQEVMTTFWLNHFNVYLHKNDETPYYLVSYERDVIRPHALGNFEDLLVATATSPAMLLYLDNSSSTGPDSPVAEKQKQRAALGKAGKETPPGLNENYARELMELHTLGVNGGYTQKDVTEVAKVFTGWTVDHPQLGGEFKFDESRHQPGKKLVLGHKIKENGQKEGLQILHLLATSPATAHFISQELAIAFVSDNPPPALVNRMAKEFLSTEGDIPSVLRAMIHSPEFWTQENYQAKVKTPLEYIVSAARASGAEIDNPQPLVNALNQMGMPLYSCVPPTGYSDKADAWVSTGELVTRMNFALTLANNRYNGIKPQWNPALLQVSTPAEAEQSLEARILPAGVSDKTRSAVLEQSLVQSQPQVQLQPQVQIFPKPAAKPVDDAQTRPKPPNPNAQANALEKQNSQIAGLLLGSPEFQRR